MSSAILFLAIVAIWAFMLVPRWIRRPHALPTDTGDLVGSPGAVAPDLIAGPDFTADAAFTAGDQLGAVPTTVTASSSPVGVAPPPSPARRAGPARRPAAAPGFASAPQTSPAGPAVSRASILRARRRMLTILVALVAVVALSAAAGFGHWWMEVPPAGMLGLYLLLLREAARADAEADYRRAVAAATARDAARATARQEAADRAARERARQAWEAMAPEPAAQVIDISARVGDQLYDQYADAAYRAVGD